jgi:hypothetical protein
VLKACSLARNAGLVVRGKHWLVLVPHGDGSKLRRMMQQQLNDPPVLAFSAIPHQIGRYACSSQQLACYYLLP